MYLLYASFSVDLCFAWIQRICMFIAVATSCSLSPKTFYCKETTEEKPGRKNKILTGCHTCSNRWLCTIDQHFWKYTINRGKTSTECRTRCEDQSMSCTRHCQNQGVFSESISLAEGTGTQNYVSWRRVSKIFLPSHYRSPALSYLPLA